MDPETKHHQFRQAPKRERRVRFADSMGMELASIFLFDLISNYYFASIHNHKQLPPPPKAAPNTAPRPITSSQNTLKASPISPNKPSFTISSSLPSKPAITQTSQRISILNNKFSSKQSNISSYNNSTSCWGIHDSGRQVENQQQQHQQQQQQQQLQKPQQQYQKQLNNNNINSSANNNISNNSSININPSPTYNCQFIQPISLISFNERVKLSKVQLETCSVNSRAGNISVSCTIRVLNQSYDKSVILRYTTDEWHTSTDTLASYRPGSCDGWSDKFTSTFSVTNQVKHFKNGQRIIFAIRYVCGGGEVFWDNNGGLNYSIEKTSD